MKLFFLFLLFFLCIGCTNKNQEKANILDQELAVAPLLSTSFDSLLQIARELPISQRVRIISQAVCREERGKSSLLKQEKLLLEILLIAPKKKEVLLQLSNLYVKMDGEYILDADKKGIKHCEELENNYSLSQEERWEVERNKALLLNRRGQQKQYLPIWAELLAEHQAENNAELTIEDLCIIANHFAKLGDSEKGLSLYREAYQLAIDNQFIDLQEKCLTALINISHDSKKYQEVINYFHTSKIDSASSLVPSTYSILATCYLELNKPDSARVYLSKMNSLSKRGSGFYIYCRIAETYIVESREDSAAINLDKAMSLFKEQTKQFQKLNIRVFLPAPFLAVYPSFATLLHKNGKTRQAYETFELVEPLMTERVKEPARLEEQIKGLTLFSGFCRSTGKYEKALDLLAHRDSIQNICNKYREERDSKNIIDYHESEALIANTKVDIAKELYYKRFLMVLGTAGLTTFFIAVFFFYLYNKLRKKIHANNEQEQKSLSSPIDPIKLRFLAVEKEVLSRKLYLNKKLSLLVLQEELKINRGDLSKCINAYSGGNFNKWVNKMRIDYALEHIQQTDLNTLIGESGFASSSSFYDWFKELTGYAPKEYLDRQLNESLLAKQKEKRQPFN